MKYLLSVGAIGVFTLGLAANADAVTTNTRNSAVVCQPDGHHEDFDFTTTGALVNISTGSRTVICAVPAPTGLESTYNVSLDFADGAQGTNCTMRAVADGTVLMSTSGVWNGGNSDLNLSMSGFGSTFKEAQVRCALPAGGGISMVSVTTF